MNRRSAIIDTRNRMGARSAITQISRIRKRQAVAKTSAVRVSQAGSEGPTGRAMAGDADVIKVWRILMAGRANAKEASSQNCRKDREIVFYMAAITRAA